MIPDRKSPETIFGEAIAIESPEDRAAFLDQACEDDPELRCELERLVADHFAAGDFLEHPAATVDMPPIAERPGRTIGRYKLLEEIGEGGMGVVYMAEQLQPVHRKVASKIIKPGMDTREVVARFEAERQALALMDHPNIAQVLDGGATGEGKGDRSDLCEAPGGPSRQIGPVPFSAGRPYFVMELVRGIPLTEYCDRNNLTTRERLELFVQVCRAVQHAHTKGIIHRDLTPSHVMVTLHDGVPVPKIIDFGIAKAMSGKLTEKTLFTSYGQMIGTPLYMSPEQAELSGLDVDTRSDIYSLGVVLYELLTGSTPFDQERLRTAGYDEIRGMIREEEPPKPSTRISTLGAAATTVSSHRKTEPAKLSRLFRREVDWIVMKALEKDRTRRYETASAMAADIQRYLDDKPVEACPPSAAYRFRKFVRRNRPKVVAVTTVALSLVAVLISGIVLFAVAFRAEKSLRRKAEQLQQRAEVSELGARRTAYASDVMLASPAWRDGDVRQFVQLLDHQRPTGTEPDLRGFEWYYLRQLPRVKNFELAGQQGAVYCLCCSPDGRLVATAGKEATLRVYDVDSRQLRTSIKTGQGEVNGISFAPDGRRIVSAGDDGTAKIWDLDTGKQVLRIAASPEELYQVLYTPDGKLLISCGADPVVHLWDAHTGKPQGDLSAHGRAVEAMALSPDGRTLGSASSDKNAALWDIASRKVVRRLRGHRERLSSIAFSPDGRWVATGSIDKTVRVWDATSGAWVSTFRHLDGVQCLAFGPESHWLAAGDRGGVIRLWPDAWKLPDWSFGAEGLVRWCGISPDGHTVAAVTPEHVLFRDLATREIRELKFADANVLQDVFYDGCAKLCAFSSTGKMFACLTEIHCADPSVSAGWKLKTKLDEDYRKLTCLAFSPDGRTLATGMRDGSVSLWDTETGKRRARLPGHRRGPVFEVAYSPDGRRLASGGEDGFAIVWDARGSKKAVFQHPNKVSCVEFSPDGSHLATGCWDGRARLWSLKSGRNVATLVGHRSGVKSLAFSPDGSRLASAGFRIQHHTVRVWDVKSRQVWRAYLANGSFVSFLPDGKTHMCGGRHSDSIRFWNLQDDKTPRGRLGKTLKLHQGRVYALASLAKTGRWVSAGQDGKVIVANPAVFSTEIEVDHPADDFTFTSDAGELAVASLDGVHLVDAATGDVTATLRSEHADWRSVAVTPDRRLLAAGNDEGILSIWDLRTRSEQLWRQVCRAGRRVAGGQLAFSPDGCRLAAAIWGEPNDAAQLFDTATGKLVDAFPCEACFALAYSPDGTRLAVDSQNDVLLWDIARRQLLHSLHGHTNSIRTISFSPDGRLIAAGGKDRDVLLWDADTGWLRFTLTGHRNQVASVAFSPDGRTLATADDSGWATAEKNGCVKLWHVSTGRELLELVNQPMPLGKVQFSPDGKRLAYLRGDRVLRIIHVPDFGPPSSGQPATPK